tara:strand:+ start:6382 stop:6654 length:273 start_codon:yes stop_codon:yes gene_type:complete
MISKKEYKELKAYWDFQRKIEYNKEMLRKEIDRSEESYNIELLEKDELFDYMWDEMDQEDYQDPPKSWIPINEKYQIEGESERKNIKRRK